MSRNFFRVIDYSLFPFSLLILGKVIGLFFVFNYLNIEWGIADFSGQFISATPVVYGADLQNVVSYSHAFTYFFLVVFFAGGELIRRLLDNPKLHFPQFFHSLLQNQADPKMRVQIWLSYLWLFYSIIFIDTLAGRSYSWLLIVASVVNVFLTVAFYSDNFNWEVNLKPVTFNETVQSVY